MTEFKRFSEETERAHVYRIGWLKDGAELISSEVEIVGKEEGLNAALIFAADDLRNANAELFISDADEGEMAYIEEPEAQAEEGTKEECEDVVS